MFQKLSLLFHDLLLLHNLLLKHCLLLEKHLLLLEMHHALTHLQALLLLQCRSSSCCQLHVR